MVKEKNKHRLFDLQTFEVSLVPRGANRKEFFLLKDENGEPMDKMEALNKILACELKDEAKINEIFKELDSDKMEAIKGILRLATMVEEIPEGMKEALARMIGGEYSPSEGFVETEGAPPEEVEAENNSEKETEMEKTNKEDFQGLNKDQQAKLDELFKANEVIMKENQELKEKLEKEHDDRVTKEFIAKADRFKALGVDSKEFGPILKEMSDKLEADTFEKVMNVLKAADEIADKAEIFKEAGSDAGNGNAGGAWDKIQALAKSYAEENKVKHSKAISEVLKTQEGKTLYNTYKANGGKN